MSGIPEVADLRRWSEDVARDPGSPSFLPLADAYRRQGKRDAAMRVCLRGLERHPEHVRAHGLLARLHLENGHVEKACDEWGIMLRLDAENFDAHRGLGFVSLERGDLRNAHGHLRRAAAGRLGDRMVQEALAAVMRRAAARRKAGREEPPAGSRSAPRASEEGDRGPRDPARLFASMERDRPFRGAIVVDARGLVIAGALRSEAEGMEKLLAATLGESLEEAVRTAELLDLGEWRGLVLETSRTQLHVTPLAGDHRAVLAATGDAPPGWVVRAAGVVTEIASEFLEEARGRHG